MKKVTSKKSAIFIGLMFLTMIPPKAWGYAEKDLPPSFSDKPFSSDDTFAFSHAILTDENGVAICQVNLVENPDFLPEFAEPGASDLEPLDLPECEQQNLDIVAQYAQQAWIKKEVAIAPALSTTVAVVGAVASFYGGCAIGLTWRVAEEKPKSGVIISGAYGGINGVLTSIPKSSGLFKLGVIMGNISIGTTSALICYGITDRILYIRSWHSQDQENEWPDMP